MYKIVFGLITVVLVGGGWYVAATSQKAAKLEMEAKAMMEKEKMEMEQTAMTEQEVMEKEEMTKAEAEEMMKDGEMKGEEGTMMKEEADEKMMLAPGSYETYSADKLALADKGDVVLFFRASWCPTCKALDGSIKENLGSIPAGVTILDVNYDNATALKQKYGVTYQHTLVQVDAAGNLITKWSGSPTLADLVSEIQ